MVDNWRRIEKIVKWSGASSVNAFARNIGLNRAENLYQIKRGNNNISRELAEIITNTYPHLSKGWILTGEGEMLVKDGQANQKYTIPFYNMDAIGMLLSADSVEPQYSLTLPVFEGCEFAAMHYGDSMSPDIGSGSVILCRLANLETLTPGENYLVISETFNGVRCVRRDPSGKKLRLVARNGEKYDDIIIKCHCVSKIYHIAGLIIKMI